MATAYKAPFDFVQKNWKNWQKEEAEYIAKLKNWCKKNSPSKNPIVGETVMTGVADGNAVYMVFNTKPFQLIHVPIGDAWNASACWLRGLRLADAKKMIESNKAVAKIFGKE